MRKMSLCKKCMALFVVVVMMITVFSTTINAFADENIKVFLNGEQLYFDVEPMTINDRTMVPMRAIFEALGAQVTWIEKNQVIIATKGNMIIAMAIDSDVMLVTDLETGKEDRLTLDVTPKLIGDRTLVPLRAISESLGCNVEWNEAEQSVYITSNASSTVPKSQNYSNPSSNSSSGSKSSNYNSGSSSSGGFYTSFNKVVDGIKSKGKYDYKNGVYLYEADRNNIATLTLSYIDDGSLVFIFIMDKNTIALVLNDKNAMMSSTIRVDGDEYTVAYSAAPYGTRWELYKKYPLYYGEVENSMKKALNSALDIIDGILVRDFGVSLSDMGMYIKF